MKSYYTKKELLKLLKKRGIDKDDFFFVFQFINKNCEGKGKYCMGCVEDTFTVLRFIAQEIFKEIEEKLKKRWCG